MWLVQFTVHSYLWFSIDCLIWSSQCVQQQRSISFFARSSLAGWRFTFENSRRWHITFYPLLFCEPKVATQIGNMSRNAKLLLRLWSSPQQRGFSVVGVRNFAVLASRQGRFPGSRALAGSILKDSDAAMFSLLPSTTTVSAVPRRFVSTPVNTVVKFVPHQEGKASIVRLIDWLIELTFSQIFYERL